MLSQNTDARERQLANLKPWQAGECPNPGGRPKGTTVAAQLAPLLKGYKLSGLVQRGKEITPNDLWCALAARYEMAILDPDTSVRDLTTVGRQIGEAAGILGMTRIHTTHDHYAHIPDELKPLIAEKLALLEYQQKQKECLLGQPPVPTLAGGEEDVSSPSTDTQK